MCVRVYCVAQSDGGVPLVRCRGINIRGLQCGMTNYKYRYGNQMSGKPLDEGEEYCTVHAPPPPRECQERGCKITSAFWEDRSDPVAKPLAEGEDYCVYHNGSYRQCFGVTVREKRCRMTAAFFNVAKNPVAYPLACGEDYCTRHAPALPNRCQALNCKRQQCKVTEEFWHERRDPVAEPLAEGARYCSVHED